MSAKEEPQKNLYLRLGSVARAEIVVVDRRRVASVERCSLGIILRVVG